MRVPAYLPSLQQEWSPTGFNNQTTEGERERRQQQGGKSLSLCSCFMIKDDKEFESKDELEELLKGQGVEC